MGKTDANWHAANRMPKNATDAQRIEWHKRHAEHCQCRPIPERVRELMSRKAPAAGYSGKPLPEKLGIKLGFKVRLMDAPTHIAELIPPGVQLQRSANAETDLVHLFVTSQPKLEKDRMGFLAQESGEGGDGCEWRHHSSRCPSAGLGRHQSLCGR
jgi:hypothetical protein